MTSKQRFDSAEFAAQYHYDGVLGAQYTSSQTVFRLWAPTAETVTLYLYKDGEEQEAYANYELSGQEHGVWSVTLQGDLHGVYYTYIVKIEGARYHTADPYARACGCNGSRSMVVDLARTNPKGWETDKAPALPQENIIYELHIKDFSWHTGSGVKPSWRGKFLALTQQDSTIPGTDCRTMLSYIKSLGVTHIQLMPCYDYGSVDEKGQDTQYNWGYDPVNYNVPEGSYSTDPHHGEVRIKEMKQAIHALHQNGFRVIMDVVYNHTYHLDSWLWRTVPGYYYRQWDNCTPTNGSGCGNDLASERSMCGRYILDSVLYWAREYHIDGFRFDLMGLTDIPLMAKIRAALDKEFGPGEKFVLGEPWTGGSTNVIPGTVLADKGHLHDLPGGIAAFCDGTRDSVKGSVMDAEGKGFVNGSGLSASRLEPCLKGWAGPWDWFSVQDPSHTVNYVSCHDDWTLWDKLVYTMDGEKDFTGHKAEILRANRMAAAINFTCQGNLFLLSGEEFGRSKQGIRNSYNASPDLNALDWQRMEEEKELVRYYRGLIALRKQLPALLDKSKNASARFLRIWDASWNCAAALVDNEGDSPYSLLYMVYSAADKTLSLPLPLPPGTWEVLSDETNSFAWRQPRKVQSKTSVLPMSVLILGRRKPLTKAEKRRLTKGNGQR